MNEKIKELYKAAKNLTSNGSPTEYASPEDSVGCCHYCYDRFGHDDNCEFKRLDDAVIACGDEFDEE